MNVDPTSIIIFRNKYREFIVRHRVLQDLNGHPLTVNCEAVCKTPPLAQNYLTALYERAGHDNPPIAARDLMMETNYLDCRDYSQGEPA